MHKNNLSPGGKFRGNGENEGGGMPHQPGRDACAPDVGERERKSMDIVSFLGEFPSCVGVERVVY